MNDQEWERLKRLGLSDDEIAKRRAMESPDSTPLDDTPPEVREAMGVLDSALRSARIAMTNRMIELMESAYEAVMPGDPRIAGAISLARDYAAKVEQARTPLPGYLTGGAVSEQGPNEADGGAKRVSGIRAIIAANEAMREEALGRIADEAREQSTSRTEFTLDDSSDIGAFLRSIATPKKPDDTTPKD